MRLYTSPFAVSTTETSSRGIAAEKALRQNVVGGTREVGMDVVSMDVVLVDVVLVATGVRR
jgi:hypothetical protein